MFFFSNCPLWAMDYRMLDAASMTSCACAFDRAHFDPSARRETAYKSCATATHAAHRDGRFRGQG
eukprot:gene6327-61341_t